MTKTSAREFAADGTDDQGFLPAEKSTILNYKSGGFDRPFGFLVAFFKKSKKSQRPESCTITVF